MEKSTQGETTPKISQQTYKLPDTLAKDVTQNVNDWRAAGKVRRLWQRDASLWTNSDEAQWLGWLDITEKQTGEERPISAVGGRNSQGKFQRHSFARHGRI